MGKKGGTETQTVKLPREIEQAAKDNLRIADEVSAIGATPYQGNTLAAFAPQQMAAMQGYDQAASAFGMPSAVDWQQGDQGQFSAPGMDNDSMYSALTGMAAPEMRGGMMGHSPMAAYEDAIARMPPAQRAAIESFVMNPNTGAGPTNLSVPSPQTQFGPGGQTNSRADLLLPYVTTGRNQRQWQDNRSGEGGRARDSHSSYDPYSGGGFGGFGGAVSDFANNAVDSMGFGAVGAIRDAVRGGPRESSRGGGIGKGG